ncbi:MAG: arginine--tRNA ligase [Candidatus Xenobiia bacterium LiM19]
MQKKDVIEQAVKESLHIIEGREWSGDRKAEVAEVVGPGAIKYHDLSQNRKKTVTFDW